MQMTLAVDVRKKIYLSIIMKYFAHDKNGIYRNDLIILFIHCVGIPESKKYLNYGRNISNIE